MKEVLSHSHLLGNKVPPLLDITIGELLDEAVQKYPDNSARSFKTSDYVSMVVELTPSIETSTFGNLNSNRIPTLNAVVFIDDKQEPGFVEFLTLATKGTDNIVDLDAVSNAISPDHAVNIQFTSGTTGSPKAATLTHRNIVNNAYFTGKGIGLSNSDVLCSPVPLDHCFGMVLAALACASYGATLVLPDGSFDPVSTMKAVEKEGCRALYGVPTMFSVMLNHPLRSDFNFSSLRTGIVAGALCPKVLMQQIISDMGMNEVTNCYGMTETSPVSFQSSVDDDLETKTVTVGLIPPHVEARIINSQGVTVALGDRGELCMKGYSVMKGYWNDDSRTDEAIVDGWMHTGDEVMIDGNGYCSIVGRIKGTIIRGGENIAPKEIEDFLLTHEGILEAQAFGVSDSKYGESVAVWLPLRNDAVLTEDQVKEFSGDQIAHYKVPSHVRFVEEFPMTAPGKVQNFLMRAEMEKMI